MECLHPVPCSECGTIVQLSGRYASRAKSTICEKCDPNSPYNRPILSPLIKGDNSTVSATPVIKLFTAVRIGIAGIFAIGVAATINAKNAERNLAEYRANAPEWAQVTAGIACKQATEGADPALLVAAVKRENYALGNNFQATLTADKDRAIGFLRTEMRIQCPEHFKY